MHYSVLLKEAVELLAIKPDGIYVDATLGRCGHTREILNKLSENGRLIAFDRDLDAIKYAKENIADKRLTLVHDNFASIKDRLASLGIDQIDGILLDLGVSSPQLDEAARGFSFNKEAKIDMRMDNTRGESALEWINRVSSEEIANVLWKYGEEKFSRKIAYNIVSYRENKPIETTTELARIVEKSIPYKKRDKHPATRSFQAIRIYINDELGSLELLLKDIPDLLKVNARVVIISFHSLEDRIVKTAFNELVNQNKLPKWVMQQDVEQNYRIVAKKIKANQSEIEENTRSRSAVLRALEKVK